MIQDSSALGSPPVDAATPETFDVTSPAVEASQEVTVPSRTTDERAGEVRESGDDLLEVRDSGFDEEHLPDEGSVDARLDALEAMVRGMAEATVHFRERAEFQESQVRFLQERVEVLQTDQVQTLLGPVLSSVAKLLSLAEDSAQRAANSAEAYDATVEFTFFHDSLEDALGMMGIDSVGARPGQDFDRTLHAARKGVATVDENQAGTIARVLRQGLVRSGADRAFMPAQVEVYRLKVPSTNKPQATPVDQGVEAPVSDSRNAPAIPNERPQEEQDQESKNE